MVLLLYFWNLLQRVFFRERERERFFEFNGNINMALVFKIGGLDTEICEGK